MADEKGSKVKLQAIGGRVCIMTREHCIPFDTVARVEFFNLDGEIEEESMTINPTLGGARIFAYSDKERAAVVLCFPEAKALRRVLATG